MTTWNPNFLPLIEAYPILISLPPTLYFYHIPCTNILLDYPHDHRAQVSDQRRVSLILFYPHNHRIFSIAIVAISRSYSYYPTIFLFYDHIALPCRLRHGCTHDGGPAHKWMRLGRIWITTSVCGEGLDFLMTKRTFFAHSHLPSQTQRQQDPPILDTSHRRPRL